MCLTKYRFEYYMYMIGILGRQMNEQEPVLVEHSMDLMQANAEILIICTLHSLIPSTF